MNGETSWGSIEKFPGVKESVDSMMTSIKYDDNVIKSIVDYLKNRYASRGAF
jgi:hypothetical protein